jgi:cardiolipin synthase
MGAGNRELTASDKIVTIPNVITIARAGAAACMLWLLLDGQSRTVVFCCLWFTAFLDGVDGYVARRLNQVSRLGVFLDPALDRLLMLAMAVIFWLSSVIPGWLTTLLVARDTAIVIIGITAIHTGRAVPVSVVGKFGSLLLSLGLPALLVTEHSFPGAILIRALGICFTAAGSLPLP